MRVAGWAVVTCGLGLLAAGPARAGLYNPGESDETAIHPKFFGEPGKNFRDVLLTLRSIGADIVDFDNPVRRRYLLQAELLSRYPLSNLRRNEDRLQASAVLLRRGKFEDAKNFLRPIATQQRENFLIQANLATAYHLKGELQPAWDTLNDALKHWPEHWADLPEEQRKFLEGLGWNEGPYAHYRKAEQTYLKLLRLRMRAALAKKEVEAVDALFDDGDKEKPAPVRYVSEQGAFEPGKIAAAEKAKVREALPVVQQLLVWLPHDPRLYWQLGELYNAQGTDEGVQAAHYIFNDLVENLKFPSKEVNERLDRLDTAAEEIQERKNRELQKQLVGVEDKADDALPFDWRTLLIGFGAGFVVALFTVWQVRELRRRRQATTTR